MIGLIVIIAWSVMAWFALRGVLDHYKKDIVISVPTFKHSWNDSVKIHDKIRARKIENEWNELKKMYIQSEK